MTTCSKCGTGECACKRPLAVGEKVMVYGWANRTPFKAEIFDIGPDFMRVIEPGNPLYKSVHPKQCRRIKTRAPKVERDRLWAKVSVEVFDKHKGDALGYDRQFNFFFSDSGEMLKKLIKPLEGNGTLVCLKPGEVPVDRAKLAEAWGKSGLSRPDSQFSGFYDLANNLGLPEEKP